MTNGAMFGVASALMKHVVDENYTMAIIVCQKILKELEQRQKDSHEDKVNT